MAKPRRFETIVVYFEPREMAAIRKRAKGGGITPEQWLLRAARTAEHVAMPKARRERFEVVAIKGVWYGRHIGRVRDEDGKLSASSRQKAWVVKTAVEHARSRKPAQLFIKGERGKIQDERTYGSDPRATRG